MGAMIAMLYIDRDYLPFRGLYRYFHTGTYW